MADTDEKTIARMASILAMDLLFDDAAVRFSGLEELFLAVIHDERERVGPHPTGRFGPRLDVLLKERNRQARNNEVSEEELLLQIERIGVDGLN